VSDLTTLREPGGAGRRQPAGWSWFWCQHCTPAWARWRRGGEVALRVHHYSCPSGHVAVEPAAWWHTTHRAGDVPTAPPAGTR
jgi:hypothetical protein